ncbi:MAG: chemotaxis protein CheW [Holophaga sp.]|nr:chemotaxis protein CheW [Holophaga sp.]
MNIQAEAVQETALEDSAAPCQYLSFQLDGHIYAVPLAQVAEITPHPELNRIPHMPKSVEGLLDHRGQVIPVISLRSRMNLPEQEASLSRNIIVLDLGGTSPVGILVDVVDAVISATPDQMVQASPLLTGPEGAWVRGFILQGERIIALLDPTFIVAFHGARSQLHTAIAEDQEVALDQGLKELIQMAPPRAVADGARIIPQMEEAINHTEQEMGKVIDCVEAMLAGSDKGFQALVRLKQEAAMGRLKGEEKNLAEIERLGSELQDRVFGVIHQLQFQDIARQKLERVLNHIRGLQMIVGAKFRDTGRAQ